MEEQVHLGIVRRQRRPKEAPRFDRYRTQGQPGCRRGLLEEQ